jgi:hypothetical protein
VDRAGLDGTGAGMTRALADFRWTKSSGRRSKRHTRLQGWMKP